jgi:DNA-binding transcriptional MerR regulator
MYTVGRLAKRFGLSRSALLYYDRVGLLRPSAHAPGEYREYSEADAARLEQILTYRSAGMSLAEIAEVLDAPQNRVAQALESRLEALSSEIRALRDQQRLVLRLLGSGKLPEDGVLDKEAWVRLLADSGFSEEDMDAWHRAFERSSPEQHERFLRALCIPEEEIARIRAWSARGA